LQFLAGQELELQFIGQQERRLPIASCPCDGMNLRFHVSAGRNGEFGAFVADKLERNAQVILRGPKGEFVLDESSPRPLLLVAWDTGFASAESILEHAFSLELPQAMFLYWVSGTPNGHYLLNQCRAWEDALDNFRFCCLASVPANDSGLQRLAERIQRDLGRVEGYDVYAMVPPVLLESARRALGALGASDSLLRFSTASL
jgi:CDP-4-dehydro-6-deoxyglucose reductase